MAVEMLACLAAAAFVIAYLFIALHRLAYPFDLEWMEGAMVEHTWRALAGQHIYVRPTLTFTPFLYPPLYYYVSAVVAHFTGIGFFPLRLVSLVSSLVVGWFMYRLVQRDTGSRYAGALAVGLFAASYRIGGAWFDLARNDSLFLALFVAGLYVARFAVSRLDWMLAGALLALSAMTKQTALMMGAPLVLFALVTEWRKGILLPVTFGGLFGMATLAFNLRDHGWYVFYVLRLPTRLQETVSERALFWTHDILGAMPIAAALALATLILFRPWRDRRSRFWLTFAIGSLAAAWASRLHSGAYDNVLIPAYVCLAVLAAVASRQIPDCLRPPVRPFVRLAIGVLAILQFVTLRYSVADQIPTERDVGLERLFAMRIAAVSGDVLVLHHSFVPTPAGPRMHAHAWAVFDVLRAGDASSRGELQHDISAALASHRYQMIVLDKVEDWMEPDLDIGYRRTSPALDADGPWTRTGYHTRPRWIYEAR
jgi:Dolichyl-phosphate-mannose-protein mannosyltransferase